MGQTRSSLSSSSPPYPPTPHSSAPTSASKRRHSKRADSDSLSSSAHSDSSSSNHNNSPNANANANANGNSSKSKSRTPPPVGSTAAERRKSDDGDSVTHDGDGANDDDTRHADDDDTLAHDTPAADDPLPTISITATPSTFYNPWAPLPTLFPPSASQFMDEMEKTSNFNQHELDRLRKRFMKLDSDGSGSIDREEFLQIPQIANNPLASRMIAIFDDDGGGTVDFQEFVGGLSAFSSRGGREEKLRFAFKVYDIDRDGYISNGELFLVLKMMVGNNLKDTQLQQIVDKTIMEADKDGDGKLSFEEFTQMVAKTDIVKQMTLEDLF